MIPGREPVAQALNCLIGVLDEVACMALVNATYDEVAAEEQTLKWIARRTELILKLIRQRRHEKPDLRVVK